MKIVDLGASSSVINCFMAQLRDVNTQTNRTLFRGNLRRIAHAMAYEVSRTLDYSVKNIQTPLAVKEVPTYDDRIVVGTVLRAGLAFHEGFLDVFDGADAAFLSAYREEGKADDIKIHIEYIAAPHLDGSTGRQSRAGLSGLPFQRQACQAPHLLCHSLPPGHRAVAACLPRRRRYPLGGRH